MDISIVIPVYNVESYIEECLQSVANQTMTDGLECILVDDCGPDNSWEIAERFVEGYQGNILFRLVRHEQNQGLSAARNTGIKVAKGEYIYFLDSDDTITSDCIETLFKLKEKYDVELVQASYMNSSSKYVNFELCDRYLHDMALIKRTLLDYDRNPVMAQNRLVRRSVIVDNNIWFKEGIIHEDNHWTFFLSKYINRMVFTSEKLYYYRETPGSITNKKDIQKESHAFKKLIIEFCNNIDNFEIGAQKRWVFLHLLLMKNNMYYDDIEQMKYLEDKFLCINNLVERVLLLLCLRSNIGVFLKSKVVNLLQKIYLKD